MLTPNPSPTHTLAAEAETLDEVLFQCPSCPRRLIVGKRTPRLTVIEKGDFGVRHVGSLNTAPIPDVVLRHV